MKKILAMIIAIVMLFCLCSCTSQSKEEKTARAFVSAMANKDYEKATKYSTSSPDFLKEELKENDYSGLKFKSQDVDTENFVGFTFENKDGKIFKCLIDKEKVKVCIGTGFTD